MGQSGDRVKQIIEYDRFESIQFHLTGFGSHGNRGIVPDDVKCDLGNNFRDDRIDFAGHDGRTILHCRKCDLAETGLRAAGKDTQVVAHFGEIDGTCFQAGRYTDKAIQIFGCIKQIICLCQRVTGDTGEGRYNIGKIEGRGVDRGSNRSGSHVDGIHFGTDFHETVAIAGNHGRICVKRLSETHRNSIFELGAADFDHIIKFIGFLIEGIG